MNPNFLLIFICLFLGLILRQTGKFPKTAPQAFNAFIIWISLPALILIQIPSFLRRADFNFEIFIPLSMAWIQFLLAWLIFTWIGKKCQWHAVDIGALILTAGLANTSFLGFPLLESLLGKESLPFAIVVDQGSFLALSTVGMMVAALFSASSGQKIEFKKILKRILLFPPFIAVLSAVCWHFFGTYGYTTFLPVLEKLSAPLVPLALVAVGFQLTVSFSILKKFWKPLFFGLTYKLVLSPFFFIVLYSYVFSSQSFQTRITILESAMAPMITAAVIAEEFQLNVEIAHLMVGIGIPISLFSVYLWNQIPLMQQMVLH